MQTLQQTAVASSLLSTVNHERIITATFTCALQTDRVAQWLCRWGTQCSSCELLSCLFVLCSCFHSCQLNISHVCWADCHTTVPISCALCLWLSHSRPPWACFTCRLCIFYGTNGPGCRVEHSACKGAPDRLRNPNWQPTEERPRVVSCLGCKREQRACAVSGTLSLILLLEGVLCCRLEVSRIGKAALL